MRSVASVIVEMLQEAGVDRVFSVSGESYLGLLDELERRNSISVVTCRHEGGAGMMAAADAKLTGRLGVCMVSRGPGAANAAIGMHAAHQDTVPFLLLVGQVSKAHLRRDAFQEVDYAKFFSGTAKWTAELSEPSRVADVMSRAIHAACSGTPGPVVVSLPEDVLGELVEGPVPRPHRLVAGGPDDAALAEVAVHLARAERPLLIAGGELADAEGRAALLAAAEAWQVPVMCSFRRHDLFPNRHPLFAGELGFFNTPDQLKRLAESDLILAVGTRLGDLTTHGYTFPVSPQPPQTLVHVLRDPDLLGVNYVPDLALACSARSFLRDLAGKAPGVVPDRGTWPEDLKTVLEPVTTWVPKTAPDGVVFGNVIAELGRHIAPDAIVAMDAGISAGMMYRYYPWTPPQILLTPIAGTMGWGMPAAVAAAMRHPDRQVICMIGDGGMLMGGMELANAAEHGLPITIILANNASYGAIRLNLDRAHPGRRVATDLHNPDFQMLARSFGCRSFGIEREEDVAPVLAEAFATKGLTFVEVKTSLSVALQPRPA
ncbi:thiamine pyrophosphate-dependent enzyme [Enterovirga rhinocerotis]|uniref:Acetolactate synthase-1/2/3 large subunit n=1 Tax=Enterovirga rhinocerotis TaxID=1339210 RepID=A0A4R7C0Q1_9HYPH|nr:thiamine pyrophosphate-dependent enzyme [Enterovirga rhinocerotis]TDR90067.1 acetolactate synthase-1/2/3 large subunit [Enterovirga rhinocerotis]